MDKFFIVFVIHKLFEDPCIYEKDALGWVSKDDQKAFLISTELIL